MKDLVVRQKYSAARRILNSVVSVSSGDETPRLMLDILLKAYFWPEVYEALYKSGCRSYA